MSLTLTLIKKKSKSRQNYEFLKISVTDISYSVILPMKYIPLFASIVLRPRQLDSMLLEKLYQLHSLRQYNSYTMMGCIYALLLLNSLQYYKNKFFHSVLLLSISNHAVSFFHYSVGDLKQSDVRLMRNNFKESSERILKPHK